MSKLFVHYPPCASKKLEQEFDRLLRANPSLCYYGDKTEIYGHVHAVKQVSGIEGLKEKSFIGAYLVYAILFMLTRFALPPSPGRLKRRPLLREDRFKLRYHFREIDDAAVGVFVPHRDGMWPFDMWRNARRMLRQGKPVLLIVGNEKEGWRIAPLTNMPGRSVRLNRKQTFARIGAHTEPSTQEPPIVTFIKYLSGKNKD